MNRNKELKQQYRLMRPEMGVLCVRSQTGGVRHIEAARDLKAVMNRTRFQLNFGNHPSAALQAAWNERGEQDFVIEVLEVLPYGDDPAKLDYSEELQALAARWAAPGNAAGHFSYNR